MSQANQGVAFLRGINVGGHRVTGPELAAVFVAAGCRDVSTFLASGNVIFTCDFAITRDLAVRFESVLGTALGYEVPVILRTGVEVQELAVQMPFDDDALGSSQGKPQIILLRDEPSVAATTEVVAMGNQNDLLFVEGVNVFWLPSAGVLKSDLDLVAVERLIGPTTMRTKNTIDRIAKKYL
ncbi:MAG: DUF1697 domain-containing protein [Acidimicrobiales bacterium]